MRVGPAPKAKVSFLGGTQKKSAAHRERGLCARFVLGDRDPEGQWKQMTDEPQGDGKAPKQCLRRAGEKRRAWSLAGERKHVGGRVPGATQGRAGRTTFSVGERGRKRPGKPVAVASLTVESRREKRGAAQEASWRIQRT